MTTLRQELEIKKQQDEQKINEAAEKWVGNNIVVIHEKIDRRIIKSLTDKIVKFDQLFADYKNQLPSIAAQIEAVEEELQRVVTGRVNDKKAANLLKQLGYLYNSFSSFFTADLPVILMTPMMRAAKNQPEVKINVLDAPGHKAYIIRDAFKNAMLPSKEEASLLKKIYRGSQPLINATAVANEMLNLSFNELEQLTNIGKVPMIDTAKLKTPAEEEVEDGALSLQEGNQALLFEKIDKEKMEQIADILTQINKVNVAGLEDVQGAIRSLATKARREVMADKWDIPGRPSAAKQLVMFYNVLDKMRNVWPTIRKTFVDDGQLDAEEQADVRNTLAKAGADSLFQKLKGALGVKHYPGLDPDSIANTIADAMGEGGDLQAVDNFFKNTKAMPKTTNTGEPVPGPDATDSTDSSSESEPSEPAQQTSVTTTQGQELPMANMLKAVDTFRDRGLELDDDDEIAIKNLMDILSQSGLSVVKK